MIGSIAGLTDVGKSREHNEDGFLILDAGTGRELSDAVRDLALDEQAVILAVSDGMGGASAGEVASALTLQVIQERTREAGLTPASTPQDILQDWLAEGVREANRRVREAGQRDASLRGMGATVTVAVVSSRAVTLAHVGDSRAYLMKEAGLTQLTTDHTFVAQMVAGGHITPEEARTHDHRHLLLQAVGAKDVLKVDTLTVEVSPGTRVLLCSDGLYDMVEDDDIAQILSSVGDPGAQCRALVQAALDGGGFDNITALVVTLTAQPPAP